MFNVFKYLCTDHQIDDFTFIHINIFLCRYPEEKFKVIEYLSTYNQIDDLTFIYIDIFLCKYMSNHQSNYM